MSLKETLKKLEGSEFENIIAEVNADVDTIKAKALAASEKELSTLKSEVKSFKDAEHTKQVEDAIKALVGDDKEKQSLLKRLTKLEDDKDVKEQFEATLKEFPNQFKVEEQEESKEEKIETEVETEVDETIDFDSYNPESVEVKEESSSDKFVHDALSGMK